MTPTYPVSATARLRAPSQRVYGIIADYREGHPRILPKQFTSLVVEQGGVGAGTVIRCEMRLMGQRQTFRAAVTEPEPGRVLRETIIEGDPLITTFNGGAVRRRPRVRRDHPVHRASETGCSRND